LICGNWEELSANDAKLKDDSVKDDLSLKPHLNSALRAEVLFFTTQGIRYVTSQGSSKPSGSPGFVDSLSSPLRNKVSFFSSGNTEKDDGNSFNIQLSKEEAGIEKAPARGRDGHMSLARLKLDQVYSNCCSLAT